MIKKQSLLEMYCNNAIQFYAERQSCNEMLRAIKDFKNLTPSEPKIKG